MSWLWATAMNCWRAPGASSLTRISTASLAREATLQALETARVAGLRTVFDVDYRASSWLSPEEAGRQARVALPWVDVVLGNEDELSILTGEHVAGAQIQMAMAASVGLVVRKLGARGVEAHTGGQSVSVPPCPTEVVCTIGAGDGFAAGFLYALDRGLPLEECLRYGNAAAMVVISRVSCSAAMPRLEELGPFLREASPRGLERTT